MLEKSLLTSAESACAYNALSSSGAEEDMEIVQSNWNFSAVEGGTTVAAIADVNGEQVKPH